LLGISYSRIQQLVRRGRLRAAARTPKGIRIYKLAEVQRLRDERERQRNTVSV